jgi:type II secretory pathway component PulJ
MAAPSAPASHIQLTETLVRLYVFLAQSLDRCLDRSTRESFPEKDHQAFLAETRARLSEALAVNPVVKRKVEEECKRVLDLAESYLKAGAGKSALAKKLKGERDILRTKLVALSDLLAVFRAL